MFQSTGDNSSGFGLKLPDGTPGMFQEESAFAKCLPNLSFKQVGPCNGMHELANKNQIQFP